MMIGPPPDLLALIDQYQAELTKRLDTVDLALTEEELGAMAEQETAGISYRDRPAARLSSVLGRRTSRISRTRRSPTQRWMGPRRALCGRASWGARWRRCTTGVSTDGVKYVTVDETATTDAEALAQHQRVVDGLKGKQ